MPLPTLSSIATENCGWVVGVADLKLGSTVSHAFLCQYGSMLDLGTFGGSRSTAKSINIFGWVVGGANLPGDAEGHPFLYRGGKMQDLGTLGGDALADGIKTSVG